MGAKKGTSKEEVSSEPRQLKTPKYQSFRLQKRMPKVAVPKMPGAFKLFYATLKMLSKNWKLFGGLALLYGLFNILLVQGLSGALSSSQSLETTNNADSWSQFLSGIVVFTSMAGTHVNSEAASAYQFFLTLIFSLGIIWALRELYGGSMMPRIRDTLYQGMYPLVPYVVVLTIVVLQLVPVVLGAFLYGLVTASVISLTGVEVLFWTVIFGLSAVISLYLLCSSIIALYIACLPNMTPMRALRSARELIQLRRWEVMRKLLFLPVALFVCAAVITVPFIYIAAPVAGTVLFILSLLAPVIIHGYLYRVYRELL